MSFGSTIPYDKMYQEWLKKQCLWTMPIYKKAAIVGTLGVCKELQLGPFQFIDEDIAFVTVCYKDPHFHVAVILYRKQHPQTSEKTLEYIDSMAGLQNGPQGFLEGILDNACKHQGITYIGSRQMYNGTTRNYFGEKYIYEPPQALEGLFTALRVKEDFSVESYKAALTSYGIEAMKDTPRLLKYVKSLKQFTGGNCILWNHLIAGELIEQRIGSKQWMENFVTNNGTSAAAAARYSSQAVFASLGRCVLDKSRPKDKRDVCNWKPWSPYAHDCRPILH